MNPKPKKSSKTLWYNALTLLSLFLVTVADHTMILENPAAVGAVAVMTALVNMGLRLVTKTALK